MVQKYNVNISNEVACLQIIRNDLAEKKDVDQNIDRAMNTLRAIKGHISHSQNIPYTSATKEQFVDYFETVLVTTLRPEHRSMLDHLHGQLEAAARKLFVDPPAASSAATPPPLAPPPF